MDGIKGNRDIESGEKYPVIEQKPRSMTCSDCLIVTYFAITYIALIGLEIYSAYRFHQSKYYGPHEF